MEEMIPAGALKKERKYTGREDKTDFRRTKRPPNERFLLFQPDNLDLIRSIKGCQNLSFRGSPPIGSPR